MGVVMSTLEFVSSIFSWLKPKEDNQHGKTVAVAENNPVTSQTTSNSSNPNFVTNVQVTPAITLGSSSYDLRSPASLVSIPDQVQHSMMSSPGYCLQKSRSEPQYMSTRQKNETISKSDAVKWVTAKPENVEELSERAVIGGYDYDGSPFWVIRTRLGGELLPGKLNIVSKRAYVASNLEEMTSSVFEVCCIPKYKVKWVEAKNGAIPSNAVEGGKTADGEKLFIGRATFDRSLSLGKIQPSHGCCYVTDACKAHPVKNYEVLCTVKWHFKFKSKD